ncbi:carbamoyl transferase [Candidatus Dojkabacteria bacterium]|uniref:Carbamoyl transferase n=1 Tax=Candidatus Dojkabacteria bacterium TaxID=2099670 RepID=A0A955RKQ1_9BACT|nr:carbamoyl transferase [Candidatus Dojkabacteria bacterium]
MVILGLCTGIHDSSAALVKDGEIICASSQERFDRKKHSGAFPYDAIEFCLNEANIDVSEVDVVAIGMNWLKRGESRYAFRGANSKGNLKEYAENELLKDKIRELSVYKNLREDLNYGGKIVFVDHHMAHSASCFYPSGFAESAILVLDGAGEEAATSLLYADDCSINKISAINYPNSLGRYYGWITDYLGFRIESGEGKVMGLAPYGDLSLKDDLAKTLKITESGYEVNFDYFDFNVDGRKGVSKKFIEEFGPKRLPGEKITQHHMNIARGVQSLFEDAVLKVVTNLKAVTKTENLCISGGGALNSVANGRIAESGLFKNIYIYPAAGDDGSSVGAALYTYYKDQKNHQYIQSNQSPYLGKGTDPEEIEKLLQNKKVKYSRPENIYSEVAKQLDQDKIIGIYWGRAEFGPRALGNRSILANPSYEENRDRVNLKVKFREDFRPFAPSVLEEYATEYFHMNGFQSPYMIMTFQTKYPKRIRATTHVNNSARVQTVSKKLNARYWKLIHEFYKISDLPIVLNTSFNKAKDVIVNTPEQALETFLTSGIDVLVLEEFLILKDEN